MTEWLPEAEYQEKHKIVCKQIQVWEFRCNENMFELQLLKDLLNKISKKWVFQLEQGNETGYKHYQGRFSLWKVKRKPELINLIKGTDNPVFNYLQPTTKAEYKKEAFYCMKEDTRIEGPYKNTDEAAYIPKQFRNITLYNWQKQILDFKWDTRFVNVLYCPKGNIGKSTMVRIGMLKHKAIMLPAHNDGIKLIQSCHNMLSGKNLRDPHFIFCDLPRAMNQENLSGLFTAIEVIKDGYIYDERNHFKEWWYDCPNVWVFTNTLPDVNYVSLDRWKVWKVENDKVIPNEMISKNLTVDLNFFD